MGIAIREGYVEGVDQRVADFFPDHPDWRSDRLKRAVTIEHLLTMMSGLYWPESAASYSPEQNVMRQMMRSPNSVQFVLDRPMADEPGTAFNYSSGASHLLSAIVQQATGTWTVGEARAMGKWLLVPLDPGYGLLLGECGCKVLHHTSGPKVPGEHQPSPTFLASRLSNRPICDTLAPQIPSPYHRSCNEPET